MTAKSAPETTTAFAGFNEPKPINNPAASTQAASVSALNESI
jgi:hypothetical protein